MGGMNDECLLGTEIGTREKYGPAIILDNRTELTFEESLTHAECPSA